ncbi:MAG: ATP-dependent DNA helicase [Erysipelotrichaceae bacterium]|nr:ATP-dependent DNA helicase [Erysipelotrichaceae bacterium]
MEKSIKMSVHQLVDFLLRKGDIDNRVYNKNTMNEGSRLHASYQRRQDSDYIAEYYLIHTFKVDDFEVTLNGRADGIISRPFLTTIDEIKTSVMDNEEFYQEQGEWHLGQAKIYALIYALDHDLERMGVRLTYINQLNNSSLVKDFKYTKEELENYVTDLIREYLEFYKLVFSQLEKRNETSELLDFPFKKFRKGQRELAKYTFAAIKNKQNLYVEAPTGIGKTMSTLFPAVKSFSNGEVDKIFYLTAKNSGVEAAFNATKLLVEKGLRVVAIQITAKEKICACPGRGCNPDECPFAKNYYGKVRNAIIEAVTHELLLSKDVITEYAMRHQICPFEYELDLSLFSDIIICDFNYLFDPIVYMRRYFDEDNYRMVGLIDEAHNLVERGRDMYSASIDYYEFKRMKNSLKDYNHKELKTAIRRINKLFKAYQEEKEEGYNLLDDIDNKILNALSNFQKFCSDFMKKEHQKVTDELKDFYFSTIRFSKIADFFDENFKFFIYKDQKEISLNIYNLDPSSLIGESLKKLEAAVLFSGTLSPLDYYVQMLGGNEDSPVLKIPSPFPKENFKLMIAPNVSTTYKNRDNTILEVVDYIKTMVDQKVGNYFVFFPSYKYLNSVLAKFDDSSYELHVQKSEMSESEKIRFLDNFQANPKTTHIAFAVLGGIFSEGIDLLHDRLIGAIIVGVGLPQISYERDLIRNYFNENEENGFEYAYVKPGMNRVMQAVGRVIRSEEDVGAVLLIDERYMHRQYQDLFKAEWNNYRVVLTIDDLKDELVSFYKND